MGGQHAGVADKLLNSGLINAAQLSDAKNKCDQFNGRLTSTLIGLGFLIPLLYFSFKVGFIKLINLYLNGEYSNVKLRTHNRRSYY